MEDITFQEIIVGILGAIAVAFGGERGWHMFRTRGFNLKKKVEKIENNTDKLTRVIEKQTEILGGVHDTLKEIKVTNDTLTQMIIQKMA
jgi:hypothetical protein